MIKTVKLPIPVIIGIFVGFLCLVVIVTLRRKNAINKLVEAEFSGKIIDFEHAGKSTMRIALENNQGPYSIIGFTRYRYEMQKGDSLDKVANSEDIYYYKLKDNKYYLYDVFNVR
jgi:hypothetical protein